MSPLERSLHQRIQMEGPISFADFMQAALYDEAEGFYGAGRVRVGKDGDFFTSVSVGPLFGKLLASQAAQMWEILGAPSLWTLVEQGADCGNLAFDLLEALRQRAPQCFEASELILVEPLAHLQRAQAERLHAYRSKVSWVSRLEELPRFKGLHYSNELLDAFPVHRVYRVRNGWMEWRVDSTGDGFKWKLWDLTDGPLKQVSVSLPLAPEGHSVEVCLAHERWSDLLFERMECGWCLAFDYGMTNEELVSADRKDGTLCTYRAHQRGADPLRTPGALDLTAQVNFSLLAQGAQRTGWDVAGYIEQGRFLSALAALGWMEADSSDSLQWRKESLAFRTLTDPNLLGRSFKAFALSKAVPPYSDLAGFRFANRAAALLPEVSSREKASEHKNQEVPQSH